jgi:hypothetical protein
MKASRRGLKATPAMKIDPRAALRDIANADDGELLAEHLYSDVIGFSRLLEWSGNPGRAVTTIKTIVREAAQQGWKCATMCGITSFSKISSSRPAW